MEKSKTVQFLTKTHLLVIACEDGTILQNFLKCVSIEYGKPIAECYADEIGKTDLSGAEIVLVRGVRNGHGGEQKLKISQSITELKNIAKAHGAHFIVPLEKLDCEPHLVAAQLRGILLRIPESEWSEINMFVLRRRGMDLKLECEFGADAGMYIYV